MHKYVVKTLNTKEKYSDELLSNMFNIMGVCSDIRQSKLGIKPGDDLYASGETVDWSWFIGSDAYELIFAFDKETNKPLGFSILLTDSDIQEFRRYEILELWVEPEYRKQGVGTEILNYITTNYPDENVIKSINCYDKESKEFFIKNGFSGNGNTLVLDKNSLILEPRDDLDFTRVILTKFDKLNDKEKQEVMGLMDDLRSYEFQYLSGYLKDFIRKSGFPKTKVEDCDNPDLDYVLVKNLNDEIIGMVKVFPDHEGVTQCHLALSCFYVKKEYRNNKIGELILRTLFGFYPVRVTENNCKEYLYNLHVAEGNDKAIRFYERFGFKTLYPQLYKGGAIDVDKYYERT